VLHAYTKTCYVTAGYYSIWHFE